MDYSDASIPISLQHLANKFDLNLTFTERDFTMILGNHFHLVLDTINSVIGSERLSEDIDHIVLTGAGCRIPGLKRRLRETYFKAKVHCVIAPEKAICNGAAREAE